MRTALLVLGGFGPVCVHGAIVARSVTWSEVLETPPHDFINNIDLDGDGTRDFYTSTRQSMATIIPEGNNRVLAIDAVPPDLGWSILPLTASELIGDASIVSGNWRGLADRVNDIHLGGAFIYQCFEFCDSLIEGGGQVNYVGVELERDGEIRYGWVALGTPHMSSRHIIQVYGWAYETSPGTPIAAGAVPEPAAGILLLTVAAMLGFHRPRRH